MKRRKRTGRVFPGLSMSVRGYRLNADTYLVKRDGLILVESSSEREALLIARKRGKGAVATDYRGVVLGKGV